MPDEAREKLVVLFRQVFMPYSASYRPQVYLGGPDFLEQLRLACGHLNGPKLLGGRSKLPGKRVARAFSTFWPLIAILSDCEV